MALITCPDCSATVSDAAPACVRCGRPLHARPAPRAAAPDPYGIHRKADAQAQAVASNRTIAFVCYGLMLLSFMYFIPGIIALIVAYAKRGDARGTFVESHYDWQISTFWLSLVYVLGLILGGFAIAIMTEGVVVGVVGMWVFGLAITAWYLWRIIRGGLALNDNRPIS